MFQILRSVARGERRAPVHRDLGDADLAIRDHALVGQCLAQAHLAKPDIEIDDPDDALTARLMAQLAQTPIEDGAELAHRDSRREGQTLLAKTVQAFVTRNGIELGHALCVQLGIGLGHTTADLAKRFDRLAVFDLTAARLDQANLPRNLAGKVTRSLLRHPDDLATAGPPDLFVCGWTLPRLPPPLQRRLLTRVFGALPPGGCALFLVQDWRAAYRFHTEAYLRGDTTARSHCFPKAALLQVLDRSNMRLIDLVPDFIDGSFGSYLVFCQKNDAL